MLDELQCGDRAEYAVVEPTEVSERVGLCDVEFIATRKGDHVRVCVDSARLDTRIAKQSEQLTTPAPEVEHRRRARKQLDIRPLPLTHLVGRRTHPRLEGEVVGQRVLARLRRHGLGNATLAPLQPRQPLLQLPDASVPCGENADDAVDPLREPVGDLQHRVVEGALGMREGLEHAAAPARERQRPLRVGVQAWIHGLRAYAASICPMLEGRRIVITGGAGFIATTLAKELVETNEIVAIDNLHRDALSGTDLAEHPNFSFHQGDVLDGDQLTELARGATHFVHCAAIAGVETVLESPVRTMRVNVIGTYNALEAALATIDTLERFVDFSTSEVFGTHAYNVTEGQVSTIGSVGEARWTYAVSKLAGEHMAHAYHDELRLPTVTVHPFNVFGPGQIGGGAIRAFIEAALAGEDMIIRGDGSQIRAWCYVTDMVSGVHACLERPEAVGQAFNIGNPRSSVTIYDLAQRVKRLTGAPSELVFAPLGYTDVELRIPNVAKAHELLGWEPQVELDDGLARTIAWYRKKLPASV